MMKKEEHWRSDREGNFGLMDIDVSNSYGTNTWNKIEMVIQAYTKVHPQEIKEIVMDNAMIAQTLKNEYGKSKKLRYSVRIPAGLLFKLEQVEPKLFANKNMLNQFMNKYKGFRVCQKV
jgi:hypothetical protein